MKMPSATVAALSLVVAAAGFVLGACADCFFQVGGTVTDCSTMLPLAGATLTVRIDDGLHGARALPGTFTTDAAGTYRVPSDGTEICTATATLMFRRNGYAPLDVPIQGKRDDRVDACMKPVAGP
jgi:hypothetical protein